MKKTKGTGVMLFGMFAIIVIIAVLSWQETEQKRSGVKEIRVGLLLYRGMIPLSAPCVLISKKRRKRI